MDKYEYVQGIIEQSSVTFSKAFGQLEENKRNAVFSIYAYCRLVDDAIDEHNDIEALEALEEKVKRTFEGDVPDDPVFEALHETNERYPNELEPFLELIDGMRDDYHNKPIKTEEDLDEYCYKAAGTVGRMLLPIVASQSFKENKSRLVEVGVELGKAMQLTNILRDVREDFKERRIYFPDESIEHFDVEMRTVLTGMVTPGYKALTEHYIEKAKEKYRVFYDNVELFDADAVLPTYLAAAFYEAILDEIRRGGYNNVTKHHYVGKFRKWRLLRKAKKNLKQRGFDL